MGWWKQRNKHPTNPEKWSPLNSHSYNWLFFHSLFTTHKLPTRSKWLKIVKKKYLGNSSCPLSNKMQRFTQKLIASKVCKVGRRQKSNTALIFYYFSFNIKGSPMSTGYLFFPLRVNWPNKWNLRGCSLPSTGYQKLGHFLCHRSQAIFFGVYIKKGKKLDTKYL